jgi:7-cyano-7-deazaguanine tRNA-ribosyltransferase
VPFVREGKSVFAQFVVSMDPGLRPLDEAIIVDGSDNLAGFGRIILLEQEAKSFTRGVAVKIREGFSRSG